MIPEYPGFCSAQDVHRSLNAPVIGEIPWIDSVGQRGKGGNGLHLQNPFTSPPPPLQSAIEGLHDALGLSEGLGGAKVFQVTSTISGEGKSTLSMMLAASLASAGLNTLLMDTSIRWQKLSQRLNMHNGSGLAELLDGVPTVQQIQASLQRCDALRVTFLSAGHSRKYPIDLLDNGKLGPIMARLRSTFDCIVLDSPSVDLMVDGIILSEFSDRLLYVVRYGFPPQDHVYAAVRRLSFYKAVSGFVLNQVRPQPPLGTQA